jgi:hypothetical protein
VGAAAELARRGQEVALGIVQIGEKQTRHAAGGGPLTSAWKAEGEFGFDLSKAK